LFEAQNQIYAQRDTLIASLEQQLDQRAQATPLFAVRWDLRD
jgi:hypothetical protein